MSGRWPGMAGVLLVVLGIALVGAGAVLGSNDIFASNAGPGSSPGTGNGYGYGLGMMRGYASGPGFDNGPQPGDTSFVAGTADAPRLIQIIAGPGYTFTPSNITVQRGETVTFAVTTMGPLVHEFMVGPADAVAADQDGTLEIADIGMMQTKTLAYTFDGSGPYAFACHAPGHYEAGMRGTITVVG